MKTIPIARLLAACAIAAGALAGTPVSADDSHHGTAALAVSADALTSGEVRKVDPAAGRVTIKHGPIVNLAMPAMTMGFDVPDRTLLSGLKVGEQIRFRAENPAGKLTVTEIRRGR